MVIAAVSGFGIYYCTRASVSFIVYHDAKYGEEDLAPEDIAVLCDKAHDLYPWNYNACIFTAQEAIYNLHKDREKLQQRREIASTWSERGLKMNPYKSRLRYVKMRLIEQRSLKDATEYWEEHVDWEFFKPYNHSVLVDLYAKSGDYDKAFESMRWVKGTKHYKAAKESLDQAWKSDQSMTEK